MGEWRCSLYAAFWAVIVVLPALPHANLHDALQLPAAGKRSGPAGTCGSGGCLLQPELCLLAATALGQAEAGAPPGQAEAPGQGSRAAIAGARALKQCGI